MESKRAHYNSRVSNSSQKQLFQLIGGLFKIKGSPIYDSELELADRFSALFTDKIKAVRSELDVVPPSSLSSPFHEQAPSCTLSAFEAVSSQVVRKSIMAAPSKSCSLDLLPTSLLKEVIDDLLPSITFIVNRSLESGEFPASLKHGLVTPSLKDSDLDHEVLENYRPISNLPFLGKVIECIVAMQCSSNTIRPLMICIPRPSLHTVRTTAPRLPCYVSLMTSTWPLKILIRLF